MNLALESLVVVGCLCLVVSLLQAWSLSAMRYMQLGFVKRVFRNYGYLLKSHIDFLMMAGLLFVTYLLFRHFELQPPSIVLISMCVGSLLNPLGFMALAVNPELPQTPASVFGAIMSGSFVLTTIGYGGAAWSIGRAALALI